MSQDWAIEEIVPGTTSPATDVVKITDALLALKSKFSGASLPTTNMYGGMEVVLTDGARYFRNAANDGWLYAGRVDEYSRGSVAMHATTMDLWAQPKIIDGTGAAVTITAIANAPQAGAVRIVYPPAGTVITHGATFSVQGGASYTTAAGDALVIEAVTTSTYKVSVIPAKGVMPGSVLQTVGTVNTTLAETTNTAMQDSGLGLSITPKYANSKLLIKFSIAITIPSSSTAGFMALAITDGATTIYGDDRAIAPVSGAFVHGRFCGEALIDATDTASREYFVAYATGTSGQACQINHAGLRTSSITIEEISQ